MISIWETVNYWKLNKLRGALCAMEELLMLSADEIPGEWQKGGDEKFSIKLLN